MRFLKAYDTTGPALLLLLLLPFLLSCSDDGSGPGDELAALVGTWKATSLVMTNQANPEISLDLVEQGANFTLSILSTGQYSASLTAFGVTHTEVGTVEVSGDHVTIAPTTPPGPAIVGFWSLQGESLILDGESEFDFNQDGEEEPSLTHIVFIPFDV
jgi:hypothetical protein